MNLKVSIALCTYNGEKYLTEQLNSFLCQSILPDEVIICDDCSTDSTVTIISDFIERASFEIKLYQNESTLKSTKNFEKAISLCTGDYIFLCDQDDIWVNSKIEKMTDILLKNQSVDIVFSNAFLINSDGKLFKHKLWDSSRCNKVIINRLKNNHQFEIFLRKNYATGACMVFRRNIVNKIIPIPNSWVHDHYIAFVASTFTKIYPLDECLIYYRQHENQQIGGAKNKFFKKVFIRLFYKKNSHREYSSKIPDALQILESKNLLTKEQLFKINDFNQFMNARNDIIKKPLYKRFFIILFSLNIYLRYVDGLYDAVSDLLKV